MKGDPGMAYTDFEFYATTYHGNVVPEADFPRIADRASDFLDVITFDRLVDGLPSDERAATFQSTSLSRGKTPPSFMPVTLTPLSIHFPLTREDPVLLMPSFRFFLSIHFPLTREDGCFPR